MAYRIKRGDATLGAAFRRIAAEQIERGMEEARDPESIGTANAVHQVRKRCKKVRGLIRLVRPGFEDYKQANKDLRDIARGLSGHRDTGTLIETHDALMKRAGADRSRFAPVRAALTRDHNASEDAGDTGAALARAHDDLATVAATVPEWLLRGKSRKTLELGLSRSFGQARTAMARARKDPSVDAMHEWRKRVKDHWYHARILHPVWPDMMTPERRAAGRLSELLGLHHDLALYADRLVTGDLPDGEGGRVTALAEHAREQSAIIEQDAFALGAFLFAEDETAFAARWTRWWRIWKGSGAPT
ncbi:CHAD domain-containing protein [Tropicimonas sp. IMCC34011]|uniref:CHAD domain-containing protein n=1 Tax=Tropicimonas sp. IMCC34011 TaxID=2248759 RepID=UPI00130082F5|nr:CHAD domain-containing protein [Tropicimonas sp. IMCC34011]